MVIVDDFVFVHMPKTGGTFVTHVLERLHATLSHPNQPRRFPRLSRLFTRRSSPSLLKLEPKHGTCAEIPRRYADRPVLSAIRNPYDWYVSQYEFAWWKKTFVYHPEPAPTPAGSAIERVLPEFQQAHPSFPDLSFAEFMELCDRAAAVYDEGRAPGFGLYTHSVVRYYYREPDRVLARLARGDVDVLRDRSFKFDVTFVRTHRLKRDLTDFLLSRGYSEDDVAFIEGLGKILPMGQGRTADQSWEGYYTPELKASVRQRDWPVFELFPAFDG